MCVRKYGATHYLRLKLNCDIHALTNLPHLQGFNFSLCGMLIWTLILPGQFETHDNFFLTPGIEQTFVDSTTLIEPSHYAN